MDVMPQTPNMQGAIENVKNLILMGFLFESFSDNIVAFAGGGQAGATPITTEVARVTTVANAGDSILLPPAVQGLTLMVINHGAKPMQVFGTGSDMIDDQAAATGVTQMVNSVVIFLCTTAGRWYANGLGTGFAGAFETQSYTDGLTAHAGVAQVGATPITTMISRFTTVATIGDSAILPVSVAGMNITVINAAANAMSVFPDVGSALNGTLNTQQSVPGGKTAIFYTTVAGAWHMMLSA
jgi:hypothetical protein